MKYFFSLLVALSVCLASIAQDPIYIKYETEVTASGEEGKMMATMMQGTAMEIAISSKKNWVKTTMGSMMGMTMELVLTEKKEMTMLMDGYMGTMAFRGDPDELSNENDEQATETNLELLNETKKIVGYDCKKAVVTDAEGNSAIYWYTDKIKRPEGVKQMPNEIPGLCLQFEMSPQEGFSIKYTAVEVNKNADMSQYKVDIPEGIEIQDLKEMGNMGGE